VAGRRTVWTDGPNGASWVVFSSSTPPMETGPPSCEPSVEGAASQPLWKDKVSADG
jgi:hypothetical protein